MFDKVPVPPDHAGEDLGMVGIERLATGGAVARLYPDLPQYSTIAPMSAIGGKLAVAATWRLGALIAKSRLSQNANITLEVT